MLTNTSYSVVLGLFRKFPTGKMILRLEDEVMYDIIYLDQPMVMQVPPIEENPYSYVTIIPAQSLDQPDEVW